MSVQKLRKVYPGKPPFVAVDQVSFDLEEGEILGLLGPNGAGKTTIIQMLLGTLTLTEGEIVYFNKDFITHRSEVLKKVVFASTYFNLPWKLTIAQNLNVFGQLYGLSSKQIKERQDPLLERFGILHKKHAVVSELSAGQTTRLMLVKAFLVQPKILLLDEPTASLDPDIAQEVCQFLLEQRDREGLSILFTSHKMDEVAEICDRILFLEKGKIIANDHPEKLARSVSKCKIQLLVGDGMKRTMSVADTLKMPYRVDHRNIEVEIEESQIANLLTALAQSGVTYTNIKVVQPTLEDYFLKMVHK